MKHIKISIGLFMTMFFITAQAQVPLKVGVILDLDPISFKESNGSFAGAAVDLFSHIAQELKWSYEFVPLEPLFDKAVEKVRKKELDVLVGPISVNLERYKLIDFSRPFFLGSFGLAVKKVDKSNLLETILSDLKENIAYFLPIMIILFICVMISFYFIDNKGRPKTLKLFFPRMGKAFWETLLILIQSEFNDSHLIIRRLVLLFWLLPSMVFFSIIVGSITSSLTEMERKKESVRFITKEDLVGKKIALLEGRTTAAERIKNLGALVVFVPSIEEGLKLVDEGKVFGSVDEHVILEKKVHQESHLKVTMSNLSLGNSAVSFAFEKGSPLVDAFNQKLLYLKDKEFSEKICARHLGHQGHLCVL